MLKKLEKIGNSRALVIDKTILELAGLDKNSVFQITINPNGGLVIQSVELLQKKSSIEKNFNEIVEEYDQLFKNLADNY